MKTGGTLVIGARYSRINGQNGGGFGVLYPQAV